MHGDPDELSKGNYVKVLDVIHENYNHLHSFSLKNSIVFVHHVGEQRYASFLCSFGQQLIRANLEDLREEKLFDVTEKCTKLELAPF